MLKLLTLVALGGLVFATPLAASPRSDAQRVLLGAEIYARNCTVCHDNSHYMVNDLGPPLFGVVGRRIGAVSGQTYSPALMESHVRGEIWTEAALDKFLKDPGKSHPGTPMWIDLDDKKQRQALIAYLKTLSAEPK